MGDLTVLGSHHSRRLLTALNKSVVRSGIHRMHMATGSRLVRAEDDSASFMMAAKLQGNIRGQGQALVNISDAKSMLTVAEDSLETIMDVLLEMKEITLEAANVQTDTADQTGNGGGGGNGNGGGGNGNGGGGNGNGNGNGGSTDSESSLIDIYKGRLDSLSAEIDEIVAATEFNGQGLLSGSDSSFSFLVNIGPTDTFAVTIASVNSDVLNVTSDDLIVASNPSANATLSTIDSAIDTLASRLGDLGDVQKRLSYKYNNLTTARHSYQAAYSRISDANLAREQMELVKLNIVNEAGNAMLAQANASSRNLLRLIEPQEPSGGARIYSINEARGSAELSALARFKFAHLTSSEGGSTPA